MLASLATVVPLGVDEDELQGSGSIDSLQFENYSGPHAVIDSAAAIVNIGSELGREVALNLDAFSTIRPGAKYSLIHAVDGEALEKLDADILVLNENAGVDHITNLRRILTGFLEAAYGYSRDDAQTISTFVTIYNAVYRNQIAVFEKRYKDVVLENISEDKVGLSTNWADWAGKTQIVIPLNSPQGGISAVDTTTISDEAVVEALRQEEDKAVDIRENLTDLKEREKVTATEQAQAAQKDAAQQKAAGNIEQAKQSAETATVQQKLADKKTEEIKVERQEIAKDKAEIFGESVSVDVSNPVTGLFVVDSQNDLYTLITLDSVTGTVIRRSPVKQIRGKIVYTVSGVNIPVEEGDAPVSDDLYMAVCGVNDGHSATRLCLIDSTTLEVVKQSEALLSENTEFLQQNDSFYVLVEDESKYYVGSYDKNLSLKTRSELAVSPSSPLNVRPSGLLVTDETGNPRLLNISDLTTIW